MRTDDALIDQVAEALANADIEANCYFDERVDGEVFLTWGTMPEERWTVHESGTWTRGRTYYRDLARAALAAVPASDPLAFPDWVDYMEARRTRGRWSVRFMGDDPLRDRFDYWINRISETGDGPTFADAVRGAVDTATRRLAARAVRGRRRM